MLGKTDLNPKLHICVVGLNPIQDICFFSICSPYTREAPTSKEIMCNTY